MRWLCRLVCIATLWNLVACTHVPPPVAPPVVGFLGDVSPLHVQTVVVTLPQIRGAVEMTITDAAQTVVMRETVAVRADQVSIAVTPRGALGSATLHITQGAHTLLTAPVYTLVAQSTVQTSHPVYDDVFRQTVRYLQGSMRSYALNGQVVRGYRSPDNPLLWLRDHVYQAQGFRYIETDAKSLLTAFRDAQRADGSLPDWIDQPELGVTAGRKEVEADVEFLFAHGVYQAWQMSGDTEWMRSMLPAVRRAIAYTTSDPLRWDAQRGLIRRPYTIDMWDFEYGPTTTNPETGAAAPRHWIDDATVWGTFHGDNTGLVQALRMLATLEDVVGETARARQYRRMAEDVMQRVKKLSWNGRFFTHFVPQDTTWRAPGVDMEAQLSISNAYALNRGVLSGSEAQAMLETYYTRGQQQPDVVLPWFSMDPPFPAGAYGMAGRKGELPGEYVNGGIMPLVGGELARGAFAYNAEAFGFDTLRHYNVLTSRFDGTYLWYYPNGQPGISGPDTIPSDGWGASAMLAALMEGAAGVFDAGMMYSSVKLSPRWAMDGVTDATIVARYPASAGYVAYTWQMTTQQITLDVTGSGEVLVLN
ncbi:MAG: hypothetical protein ACKO83_01695, partial [Roseiflexaceae bacterium]